MEIITAVLGIVAGLAPEALKFWKHKSDQKHELEVMRLQIEAVKMKAEYSFREAEIGRDVEEAKVVYTYAPPPQQSGVKWIDGIIYGLNGLFRPLVSFYLFIFYILAKYNPAVAIYWTDFDRGLVAGVFSFFFTNRAMRYAMNQIGHVAQPVIHGTTPQSPPPSGKQKPKVGTYTEQTNDTQTHQWY